MRKYSKPSPPTRHPYVLMLLIICCLGSLPGRAAELAADAAPDLILYNAKVFTAESEDSWAEALAVRGDRIAARGTNAAVLALAAGETRRVDLAGRTVIPGLNDAHAHVALMPALTVLDFGHWIPGDGPSLDEALAALQKATAAAPPGRWIFAVTGAAITNDPAATRFALDAVAPDNPVWFRNWSGHIGILNTAGMQAVGIAEDQADDFGTYYRRVPGQQTLNGVIEEYGTFRIEGFLRALMSVDEARAQYLDYARAALRSGVTSVQDMAIGVTAERSREILDGVAELPMRWRVICFPLTPQEHCPTKRTHGKVTYYGTKWFMDGGPVERFAYLRAPYADQPGWPGHAMLPQEIIVQLIGAQTSFTPQQGQLVVHAVGDRAIDNYIAALDATGGAAVWAGRRPRLEHGDMLLPEHLDDLRRLGIVLVQNPLHLSLPEMLRARLGAARIKHIQPLRTVIEAGIPLAFGSDLEGAGTAFTELMFAALHPANPGEALSVEQAVRAYTYGSAYAEFAEQVKGTLAPGMLADLVVLSQDIFTIPIADIAQTHSIMTVVGGRIVYRQP